MVGNFPSIEYFFCQDRTQGLLESPEFQTQFFIPFFRATFSSSQKGVKPDSNGTNLQELLQQFTGKATNVMSFGPNLTSDHKLFG